MDCYSFDNLITDFLDNNLKLARRREAEEHIQKCEECRNKVTEIRVLMETMRRLQPVKASESFETDLFKKIREHQNSPDLVHSFWHYISSHGRSFSAAAVLFIVLTGSLMVWRGYNPSLDHSLPVINSSPVLSTMANPSPKKIPVSTNKGTNLTGMKNPRQFMTQKDSMDQKSKFQNPDTILPRDFRNQIKLVNERR
jgi:hypothetical protein